MATSRKRTDQTTLMRNTTPQRLDAVKLLRLELLTSLEKYTKAMFRAQHGRSFVMAKHHRLIIEKLEGVLDGKIKRLIINVAPRYSKTELVIKQFVSAGYALNPRCNFLHLSYSDTLVKDNSAQIREIMKLPIYRELFPDSELEKANKASSERWKTKAGGEFYAVSTQGQVTGFGAGQVDDIAADELDEEWLRYDDAFLNKLGLIGANSNVFSGAVIIDDPIKPDDALSDTIRERINQRFESTIRSRTNSRNTPIIIIMQRVHEHDLCGYLLETEPDEWEVLSLPAIVTDPDTGEESALWPFKHTLEELKKLREADPFVFDTQYMQEPKPKEGLLYERFNTYTSIPIEQGMKRCNYTDTADTGADYLCSICFVKGSEYNYITDVIYTQEPMEVTEPATARMLTMNKTDIARIESNNGGRGFARAVMRILKIDFRNFKTKVTWFNQSQNKYVRIHTQSAEVMNTTLMPEDWATRWPKFYNAVMSYRKDNRRRSQHDDAPDALTGTYEMRDKIDKQKKVRQVNVKKS